MCGLAGELRLALSTCLESGCVRVCQGLVGPVPVPRSGRCGQADDLVPGGEAVGHLAAVLRCGEAVAAGSEVRRDRAEDREELLSPGG